MGWDLFHRFQYYPLEISNNASSIIDRSQFKEECHQLIRLLLIIKLLATQCYFIYSLKSIQTTWRLQTPIFQEQFKVIYEVFSITRRLGGHPDKCIDQKV